MAQKKCRKTRPPSLPPAFDVKSQNTSFVSGHPRVRHLPYKKRAAGSPDRSFLFSCICRAPEIDESGKPAPQGQRASRSGAPAPRTFHEPSVAWYFSPGWVCAIRRQAVAKAYSSIVLLPAAFSV